MTGGWAGRAERHGVRAASSVGRVPSSHSRRGKTNTFVFCGSGPYEPSISFTRSKTMPEEAPATVFLYLRPDMSSFCTRNVSCVLYSQPSFICTVSFPLRFDSFDMSKESGSGRPFMSSSNFVITTRRGSSVLPPPVAATPKSCCLYRCSASSSPSFAPSSSSTVFFSGGL
jgi:hypothetical protein